MELRPATTRSERPSVSHRLAYAAMAPRPPAEGPVDLDALVPGGGPIEIDVGFGRGRSLLERAATAPGVRLVGIEIKRKWAAKVEQRRQRLGLERVRILCGDAKDILARAAPIGSVSRIFVHFPDPWWKKRHAKRRLVDAAFLDLAAHLLAAAGELFVQTDVEERAERYLAELRAHPAFHVVGDGYIADNPFEARSNREHRAGEDGLPVYRVLATRR